MEVECQHEAEADDFDGYAESDDIDDIFQTMVWASMHVIVICVILRMRVPVLVCVLLLSCGCCSSSFFVF